MIYEVKTPDRKHLPSFIHSNSDLVAKTENTERVSSEEFMLNESKRIAGKFHHGIKHDEEASKAAMKQIKKDKAEANKGFSNKTIAHIC